MASFPSSLSDLQSRGRLKLVLNVCPNWASLPSFAGTCECYRNQWRLWPLSNFEKSQHLFAYPEVSYLSSFLNDGKEYWLDLSCLCSEHISVKESRSIKVKVGRGQETRKAPKTILLARSGAFWPNIFSLAVATKGKYQNQTSTQHPSSLQQLAAQRPSEQELLVLYLIAFGAFIFYAFP